MFDPDTAVVCRAQPGACKYWLSRIGLIDSAEVRLPMVEVSPELARRLDAEMARRPRGAAAYPDGLTCNASAK